MRMNKQLFSQKVVREYLIFSNRFWVAMKTNERIDLTLAPAAS